MWRSAFRGLREAMADVSATVEEVQREVAGLKAQVSHCPKVKDDLANPERELATLKEEMRKHRGRKAATAAQRHRHEQEIRDVKRGVELLHKASGSHRSETRRLWQALKKWLGS
jgi:chromosome segregation ATPase